MRFKEIGGFGGHVYLIGYMGAGKSTVARHLAERLNMPHLEMDALLEERFQCTIKEYFALFGEEAFRSEESTLLRDIMAFHVPHLVSTGGGIIERPEHIDWMKASGTVIYLFATPDTLYKRLIQTDDRPLFSADDRRAFRARYRRRHPRYREAADCTISTERYTPKEVSERIARFLTACGPSENDAYKNGTKRGN
ncbi:MAG: Shikimate kinase I [Candidatus Carbobacillus altaicus]|uniref:Shikimate kinase n=1 Tax=Candidatus Carbonibacillus altaicus TaxID=2163959 RepID=A0A2R6XZ15_9BACL|nr:MAG: Shikimate kinase I [Candidatus Carbobacillus altaicus]